MKKLLIRILTFFYSIKIAAFDQAIENKKNGKI